MKIVTCVAPVNIAVVKYWGKRDEDLILPINDSISATLSTDFMSTKTTVMASPSFTENKLWLNGKEESFDSPRIQNCIKELRQRAELSGSTEILNWNLHICSENNFPTAAGLASSAAGYACLVKALATLYGIDDDISSIARQGSGSACRSIFGGWVRWHKGVLTDGSDSIATQIKPASYWPEVRILILVVNDAKKKDSSTDGMKRSVETSALLQYRAENVVPSRISAMEQAIAERNFQSFAELTMKDSNQFHAVCLDTYPPCVYMNDISYSIINMVHSYNKFHDSNKIAYTFDAGPNACLYLLQQDLSQIFALINAVFPSTVSPVDYIRGSSIKEEPLIEDLKKYNLVKQKADLLKYIIHTNIGNGPKLLKDDDKHLLNDAGVPIH